MKHHLNRFPQNPLFWPALFGAATLCNLTAPSGAQGADATTNTASLLWTKPAWLTDLSLGVKESWDNNVFLVSGQGAKPQSSFITTVSPKIGFNAAPLLGDQKVLQVLAFGYAPDIVTYHDEDSESYNAHRFATTIKAKTEDFSAAVDNGFNYIDGSKEAYAYAGGPNHLDKNRSAYATAAPRERRLQMQDRAKITLEYNVDRFFVRPTSSLLYYDLMTDKKNTTAVPGYQNYCDRYDVNGGADAGYKVLDNLALTTGYRYGHQYQEKYATAIDASNLSATSDYQRLLFGIETKPLKWLSISVLEGPDFRSYDHTAPVHDFHPVKNYGEGAITADITVQDSLAFKYKQWQWVSSTGKLPLLESTYDLSYRHKFTKDFSLDAGTKLGTSDYTSGTDTGSKRDDWMYTYSLGLSYNFTANLGMSLAYAVDLGRNMEDGLSTSKDGKDFRQFDHHLVSLGAIFKF